MGALSIWHWVIVLLIILILFGRGRISSLMGDMGRGISRFRREMSGLAAEGRDIERTARIDARQPIVGVATPYEGEAAGLCPQAEKNNMGRRT